MLFRSGGDARGIEGRGEENGAREAGVWARGRVDQVSFLPGHYHVEAVSAVHCPGCYTRVHLRRPPRRAQQELADFWEEAETILEEEDVCFRGDVGD